MLASPPCELRRMLHYRPVRVDTQSRTARPGTTLTDPEAAAGAGDPQGWHHQPVIALLAFLAFLCIIGAWSIATPYDGAPDEEQHLFRAAGVVAGDIMPKPEAVYNGSGAYQTIPSGIVSEDRGCWEFKPAISAACQPLPTGSRTPIRVASAAGRYSPLYYALVGWPLWLWPGWPGLLVARLVSAALAAALLASAFVCILRWSQHRLMLAGLMAAFTPMVGHLAGAVNPNGLEIAAGIAFFASAIPLLLGQREAPTQLVWVGGISAALLAALRSSGPLWVVVAFTALLVPPGLPYLRQLLRHRTLRWWALIILIALALSVAWTEVMKAADLGNFRGSVHLSLSQATFREADRWGGYLDQMVGVTSWLDTYVPAPIYRIWQFTAAGLLLWGLVLGQRADQLRLLILLAGGVLVPSALEVWYVNTQGFVTQGRYMLPLLVGVPLLSAWVLESRGVAVDQARTLTRFVVLLLLPIHFLVLIYTMVRWEKGLPPMPSLSSFNLLVNSWRPPLGSITPLVAELVGLLLIGWLVWSSSAAVRRMQASWSQLRGNDQTDSV